MRFHHNAIAALAAAAIMSPAAFGAGEPKNQLPFTRANAAAAPCRHRASV